jgi:hypothetical protein
MKNITLAMVTALAAVAILSAVLAVPMQQAIADGKEEKREKDAKHEKDGNDASDGGDGGAGVDFAIEQINKCGNNNEGASTSTCANTATGTVTNAPVLGGLID